MKKKQYIFISILMILIVGFGSILLWSSWKSEPFSKLSQDDIKTISAYTISGESVSHILSKEETIEMVELLKSFEVSGFGTKKYQDRAGGQWKMFKIEKSDGSITDVSSCTPYLILNEKGYKADDKLLKELYNLYYTFIGKL